MFSAKTVRQSLLADKRGGGVRERIVVATALVVLTFMLILTLTPLFLMFFTSFKPSGTLFQRTLDVLVADIEVGNLNSIGGPIRTEYEGTSVVEMSFVPPEPTPGKNRIMAVHYSKGDGPAEWSTRISQDMRKFSLLEFKVKGEKGGETFSIDLVDLKGRRASLDI